MASGDVKGFIEIAADEMRRHPARLLGMGLFWAWLQVVFAAPALAPASMLQLPFPSQHQVWTISLLITIVTFAIALALKRSSLPIAQSATLWTCHLLMAAGTACLAYSSEATDPLPFAFCGAVFTGIGSGLAFLVWGDHLSHLEPRRVLFDMAIYSFMTAVFFSIVMALPILLAQIAAVVMPLGAGLLLKHAQTAYVPSIDEHRKPDNASSPKGSSLISLAVLVGLVYGIMRGVSLSFTASSVEIVTVATVVGIALAGVLLVITTVFFKKGSELYLVCQISFPLLTLGFLLLPQFLGDLPLPIVVFTIGHSYFYFLLWVFCVDQARASTKKPYIIVAIGLLSFLGSSLIGSIASDAMALLGSEASQAISIVSLVVVYLFVVAFAFLFGKSRKTNQADQNANLEQEFRTCSDLVASEGGLSPRETEIFYLLAVGKDRADIREAFSISNDTVKSHTRRIYAKLDIHSKKEATALVEARIERERRGM